MAGGGLPTGTLTFLFTDLEGSTHLLQRLGDRYPALLAAHYELMRAAFGRNGGQEVGTRGDALFVVFEQPSAAVAGAATAQVALAGYDWPDDCDVRVRMGLHTGEAEVVDGDYVGVAVHAAARICSAAHGGQVLVSEVTRAIAEPELAGTETAFVELGRHRLKDLDEPVGLVQVVHPGLEREFPRLRLDAVPGNLPKQVTRFVGRESELREAAGHLSGGRRLLTFSGSGGSGKTRLALQVAAEVVDRFPDGAWLVELASVSDEAQLPHVLTTTLGVREESGRHLESTLAEALAAKRMLLMLDNCEHVLTGTAELTDLLLQACRGVQVVATSQEALGVPGEVVFRVPPMAPAEGVELFCDRARLRNRAFALTDDNRHTVADICRRLDGIPLAIELAAARVNVLTPAQILDRLGDQFRLLTGGDRTAVPRQQTLRAAVDWSHELLSKDERTLLRRLAVFSGGWTLEAAEAVTAGDGLDALDVLDLLDHLVARSLVVVEEQDGAARYRLLGSIRQYAQEKLVDAGEVVEYRRRHLEFFAELVRRGESELTGPDQAAWLARFAVEYDNVRAALDWAGSGAAGSGLLVDMAGCLWRFWLVRGPWREGRTWIARGLEVDGDAAPASVKAKALAASGGLAIEQGDLDAAQPFLDESLALWQQLGDMAGTAHALNHLGTLAMARFEYDASRALLRDALEMRRAINEERGVAVSLRNLGLLAALQRDFQTARTLYEEALPLARRLGEKRVSATITQALALVVFEDGDLEGARKLAEEGLRIDKELLNRQGIAEHLTVLAGVARAEGDGDAAAAMFTEALAIWKGLAARDAEARAYTTLGDMAHSRHDYEMARTYLTAALAAWRSLGDEAAVARILNLAGWAAAMQGDLARARGMLEEGLAVAARVGDDGQRSATLHSLGEVARLQGNLVEARALFEESLELARASGWRTVLWWPVHSLGALARTEGNLDEARERLREAIALCPKLARRPRLSDCLEDLAGVAFDEGDAARAAVLLGAADTLRRQAATPVPPAMRVSVDELVASVRDAIGADAFEQQWTAGQALTAEAAADIALQAP
ncbi:MAG TPA: tetratricopeptide repeat protein [Acidimicrobiales bacterium]|nr:tetratricopeptide repeat protein [Acidimicrobiales bacterium]